MNKKVLLIILDGCGEGKDYKYNAVTRSNTAFLDELRKKYPKTILQTEGEYVGLPKRSMGGSEVGHFTIGAGRIVYQSLEEINRSIKKGTFFNLKELKKAAKIVRKKNSKLHLLGMISDEGVHSHINHLFALLKFAKQEKLQKVYIHAITDGRDVPERSADIFIKKINAQIKKLKIGKIATIIGRYYAMDRDTNWDRTKKAYALYTLGKGTKEKSALQAIKNEYKRGTETDYYIKPILLDKNGLIENNDAVIFFNYRTDRARQITEAFTAKNFKNFICFGPYSKIAPVLFPTNKVKNNLSEYLSRKGKKQLRIAETEKYAHVTFFFNSQIKKPFKGETRILIPSPKVPSYAQKPEMSAYKITERFLKELDRKNYDLIVLNFANCDLVGHSGEFKATVKAIETLDKCIAKIVPKALKKGYTILLTADHGNAEFMRYADGKDCPAHTLNPVIFILITEEATKARASTTSVVSSTSEAAASQAPQTSVAYRIRLKQGKNLGLKDIAPTILDIMGLKKPKEMTGKSLIKK